MSPKEENERDKDLEYINFVWHRLTWWQQKKIYFRVVWYIKTQWFRNVPLRWIKYQLKKEGKNEDILY